ncbi:MAG: hypothetical protein J5675_05290 [Bacteroidales bacterium]|nr:hypothetical protein [Bacteroidales bacterium]
MKKVLYAIAMLGVAALAFSACNKDDQKVTKRLSMCGDEWDKYYFSYNSDGSLKEVNRNPADDGTYERTWTFTWNGKTATVKYVKEGEEQGPLSFTLGDNGFVSTFTDTWGDVRNVAYDKDGHMLKVDKAGDVKCNCVWENGDLKKWSRFSDGAEQFKIQSFLADENVAGIFPDATDKAGIDRWMIEVGLFGKPSKHLLDQAAWDGSDAVAVQTYVKDADGFVVKVNKVYDGGDPEIYEYAWEDVK